MQIRWLSIPPLILALLVMAQSARLIQQDIHFTGLETEVSFWGRSEYIPTETTRTRTGDGIVALLAAAPAHPNYQALRASQLAWEGYWAPGREERRELSLAVMEAQLKALENRPAHGQGWVKLVQYAPEGQAGEATRQEATTRLQSLQRWH